MKNPIAIVQSATGVSAETLRNFDLSRYLAFLGVAATITLSAIVAPLGGHQAKAQSNPAPVCLVSTGSAQPIAVMVPQARASLLLGQGFAATSCSGMGDVVGYRNQICGLAQTATPQLKSGFAAAYGVTPDLLCSYAQEIA
ncbi:MAG: hypothetical protein ABJ205_06725 [Erythrobacter sp.]|uniref:hypothetical protein n=1 Tax=Erythrobacter sp. TaxID=1042 RepID=UPI003263A27E